MRRMKAIIISTILLIYSSYSFGLEFSTGTVNIPNPATYSAELEELDFDLLKEKFAGALEDALITLETTVRNNRYTFGFLGKNRRFKRALRALRRAKLVWSEDITSWRHCGKQTAAYVVQIGPNRGNIFLCPMAYTQSREVLTQIIVHESAHLSGVTSECQASKMEMLAIYFSGIEQPFKSGYWNKCRLAKFNHTLNSKPYLR